MITPENYYTETEHFSVSQYKNYKKCELAGKLETFTVTEAMLIGSYVDAFVEGTLDQFVESHPEILSSRGATKGELKSEYKNANTICDFISNDKICNEFMSFEKQTYMTGDILCVPLRINIDS